MSFTVLLSAFVLAVPSVAGQPERRAPERGAPLGAELQACPAGSEGPCYPGGIAIDAAGNVYVADYRGNRVLEYDTPFAPGGDALADRVFGQPDFSTFEHCASFRERPLCGPVGVAIDAAGTLYVADHDGARVVIYERPLTGNGEADREIPIGDDSGEHTKLSNPWSIAVDGAGRVYVSDGSGGLLFAYDAGVSTQGAVTQAARTPRCKTTQACCNPDGTIVAVGDFKICRPATDQCDVADFCDGVSADCGFDLVRRGGAFCNYNGQPCDQPDTCDGISKACPVSTVRPASAICRPAGPCDLAEFCDGVSTICPADVVAPAGKLCRVLRDETCILRVAGDICLEWLDGSCDVPEFCDGVSGSCPFDGVASAGTVCRASAESCDAVEVCDGESFSCPPDDFTGTCGP